MVQLVCLAADDRYLKGCECEERTELGPTGSEARLPDPPLVLEWSSTMLWDGHGLGLGGPIPFRKLEAAAVGY